MSDQPSALTDPKMMRKSDPRTNLLYRPYQPWGSSLDLLYCKDPEVVISGPAGTGKSRGALEKVHLCASKYPGMRGLMIRKTRESLTQSAMVTFDRFVVPPNGTVKFRTAEQQYNYDNGSVIALGGMDKASKVLSSEYDLIYVMQAEELEEEDWEILVTRNRFGIMPYNQIIADCNPDSPRHWLKIRAERGKLTMIPSYHRDNPTLFDHEKNEWTPRGQQYLLKLDSLTGVRRLRLRDGVWAAAEGMIYDEWDPKVHLIYNRPLPKSWRRIWVVDFGYTRPLCWQAWAVDEDGIMYRFAEIYQTKLLVEDLCFQLTTWMRQTGEHLPDAIVCDHDAEGRATLERHLGVMTTPATKSILDGINAVKERMKVQGNGLPRLMFMRDSLVNGPDPELVDAKMPTCTEEEIDSYEWSDNKKKERPNDVNDHGMDATRYAVMYEEGESGGWVRGSAR